MRKNKHYWIICYDIRDAKRLKKTHQLCAAHGISLQYSLFLAYFTRQELNGFVDKISALIHLDEDDVRLHPIKSLKDISYLGHSLLPEEIEKECQTFYELVQ